MNQPFYKSLLLPLNLQLFSADLGGGAGGTKTQDEIDLKKLQTEFSDSWKNLKTLLDQQADEMRTHGETHTKTADQINKIQKDLEKYDSEIKGFSDKFSQLEVKMNRPDFGQPAKKKTAGEMFIENDSYKNRPNQSYNAGMTIERKDLDSTTAHGGIFVDPQRVGGVLTPVRPNLTMRDILNATTTTSNAIEYIIQTGFVNASAIAPEKSLKPQSDITFDIESVTVKTIAHWIPATRQIIDDAPMLRGMIDGELMFGLAQTEESQILYGTGVGDNIAGIMTNPNIQNHGGVPAGSTAIDHIRRALTRALLAGFPSTGIVLHPSDYEDIELLKTTDGQYLWVNVNNGGTPVLWRVPIIQSTSITEGTFLAGAFGLGARIYDRETANIRVSEHHADYFARNMIAILAEERLALTVQRPESFVTGSFAPAV
jgi:HK97 family phage major capsid protein